MKPAQNKWLFRLAATSAAVVATAALLSPLPAEAYKRLIPSATPHRHAQKATPSPTPMPTVAPTPVPDAPPPPSDFDQLKADVTAMANQSGAHVGIAVVDIGGPEAKSWSVNGDDTFIAASTYKEPAVMMMAERVANGQASGSDVACVRAEDLWEASWYGYSGRECLTIDTWVQRINQHSDNVAGHLMVRIDGGPDALNAWARSKGDASAHWAAFDGNTATANGMAALLAAMARGDVGGKAGQDWMYSRLSHGGYEGAIPAGVPSDVLVVHKMGWIYMTRNDAAIVVNGPHGPFVAVIYTDGLGGGVGGAADQFMAKVSSRVFDYEQYGRMTPQQRRHQKLMD